MNKKNLIILFAVVFIKSYGQSEEDMFYFNYTLAPIGNDDIDFSKMNFKLSVPIRFEKGLFSNTIKFNYYQLDYQNTNFSTENIDQLYYLGYELNYIYLISDKWNLDTSIGASISANIENTFSSNNILFDGSIALVKKGGTKEKPSQFTLGAIYSSITGAARVLPLMSYKKKVNEKLSYQLGFPKTYIDYRLNKMSTLNMSLSQDGFYGSLNNDLNVDNGAHVNRLSFSSTSLGLEYNYWMGDCWTIMLQGGYSMFNTYKLENSENMNTYKFNINDYSFFSAGVKFNL